MEKGVKFSFYLCSDILMFQKPYRYYAEGQGKNSGGGQERKETAGQGIFGLVGIHSKKHQTVGPEKSHVFVYDQHSCNASDQSDSDRNGKTAYFHGEKELKNANGDGTQDSPKKPQHDLRRAEPGKPCQFSADDI